MDPRPFELLDPDPDPDRIHVQKKHQIQILGNDVRTWIQNPVTKKKSPQKIRNALRENFSRKKLKSCTLGNPSHDNLGSEYVLLTKTTIGKSKICKNLKICDEGHACLTPALNSGRVAVLTVTYVPQQVPMLPKEDTPLSVRKGRSRVTQSASRLVQLLTRTANSLLNRWAGSWTKKFFFFLSDFQVKISKKGLRRFH